MSETKICKHCGKPFPKNGNVKYRSDSCRFAAWGEAARRYNEEKKQARFKRKANMRLCVSRDYEAGKSREYERNRESIADISEKAKEKGMSYGQYVARYGK